MKKLIFILLMAVGLLGSAFAQSQITPVTQNPQEFIRDFYDAQNKFLNGNVEMESKISQHLHPECVYLRSTEDIRGVVRTVRFNKEEFMRELRGTRNANIRIERSVNKVVYSNQIGNLANVTVILEVNFYQDTTKVASSGAYISHSLANNGGTWAIRNMLADRVLLNQSIGVCGLARSRKAPKLPETYALKVVYPNGETFETVDHTVTVKGEGAIKIFDVDNKYYYTLKEGTLYTAKIGDVQVAETLGKALAVNEALALILSKSLYKSHCLRFEAIK
ncbi:MAG: hypothetical protein FGM41_05805 [Bacteroidetes bacterium]|nr:hypothetical protein [Bacteroidota bacterium]